MLQICGWENAIFRAENIKTVQNEQGGKKRKFGLRKILFHVVVEVPQKNKIKNRKAEKRLMVKRYIRGCSIVMITLADNVHQGGGG